MQTENLLPWRPWAVRGSRLLMRLGYQVVAVYPDAVDVLDPVQCSDGHTSWVEHQVERLGSMQSVMHFIEVRS